MGASEFEVRTSGKTPDEAFRRAVEDAQYESGHGGYTGTIAEKSSFKLVTPKAGDSPLDCVRRCVDDDNHWSQDKWGPAACVRLGENEHAPGESFYAFFGWASS